jgi:hypothetical protein
MFIIVMKYNGISLENLQHFMEPEDSLLCLQEPTASPYL